MSLAPLAKTQLEPKNQKQSDIMEASYESMPDDSKVFPVIKRIQ